MRKSVQAKCFVNKTAKTGMLAGIMSECVSMSALSEVVHKAWQTGSDL